MNLGFLAKAPRVPDEATATREAEGLRLLFGGGVESELVGLGSNHFPRRSI
jgi:hypothetical protein